MVETVLIVGAGPVGLTMAIELARYQVPVRIIDKAASRSDKSKALVVWSRTLELLDRAGCASALIDAGNRVVAANILAGAEKIGRVDLTSVDSPYRFALMVPQSETERLLEAALNALGVAVERNVEITDLADRAAHVAATLSLPDGRVEIAEVGWLIGCDGAHSLVRQKLGASFLGSTNPDEWILADVHVSGLAVPATEIATYWHRDGALIFLPITPGRYRIVADLGPSSEGAPTTPTLPQCQSIVDRRGPGGVVLSDPVWLSGFRINERQVDRYRSGRIFLAGDAAHVHSPAGGQGMNTGMQDAFNLAWKLALVCRGAGAWSLLDSYEVERKAVGAEVIAGATRLTRVATMEGPVEQTVRNFVAHILLGLAPVRNHLASAMAEISVGYKDSPLNGTHSGAAGPRPGERMRPVTGHAPFGSGDTPRFAVLGRPGLGSAQFFERHAALLETTLGPSPANDGTWLVRPDGYVAMVAGADGFDEMSAYLDQWRGADAPPGQ